MATKLPNGKYRSQVYIFTDDQGKRQYKSFIADSEDEADFLALSFKLGNGKKVNKNDITVRSACIAYIDSRRGVLSPTTVQHYEMILRNFGSFLETPLRFVDEQSFQKAVTSFASEISQKTGKKDLLIV